MISPTVSKVPVSYGPGISSEKPNGGIVRPQSGKKTSTPPDILGKRKSA